jgi:hypothetical protein
VTRVLRTVAVSAGRSRVVGDSATWMTDVRQIECTGYAALVSDPRESAAARCPGSNWKPS